MKRILFVGKIGSDAGGFYIGADGKIHPIPGWGPEQFADLSHAVAALREVSQIKHTGAEHLSVALHDLLQKELGGHVKEGDVVVIG